MGLPPQIALLFCILFICVCLYLEKSYNPKVSFASWIPLIWLLLSSTKPISYWLGLGTVNISELDYEQGNPINRFVFTILIILGIIILKKRNFRFVLFIKNNYWILIWFAYCGMSIFWSDYPYVSIKRYVRGIGVIIMIMVLLSENDPITAVKTAFRRVAIFLLPLSILLIKYYRDLGVFYSPWGGSPYYAGVTHDKNGLGRLCLVCGLSLIWYLLTMQNRDDNTKAELKEWAIPVLLLAMIAWLLSKAHSATSTAALFIGISIMIILNLKSVKSKVGYINIIAIVLMLIIFILEISFNIVSLTIHSLGRDPTLTGRTELWKDLLDMVKNPFIGTGYESFWLGDRLFTLWDKYWWHPNESHNGYLDIYLELGLIGVILLVGFIIQSYSKSIKTLKTDYNSGIFRVSSLGVVLLYNITEASFGGMSLIWFVFILISLKWPPYT